MKKQFTKLEIRNLRNLAARWWLKIPTNTILTPEEVRKIKQGIITKEELEEIKEGKGAYNADQLIHAGNTIKDMKKLAEKALEILNNIKD